MKIVNVIFDSRHRGFTFDCVIFFILADIVRYINGFDSIVVRIIMNGFRKQTEREHLYSDDSKRWRLYHIVAQVPRLLESTVEISATSLLPESVPTNVFPSGYHPTHPQISAKTVFQPIVFSRFKDSGIEIRRLAAGSFAKSIVSERLGSRPFVTISLRSSKFQPARNSNIAAWLAFAEILEEMGYDVHFIPDFEDLYALSSPNLRGRLLVDAASDLQIRMAYYELAYHNFCVSNGTSALLYFSRCAFSMFGILREGVNNCTSEFLLSASGLRQDEKYYWLDERQHFIWEEDSFERIRAHFHDLVRLGQLGPVAVPDH